MSMADLSKYRAVFLIDTEFRPIPYGHVEPVCLVAKNLVSGQEYRAWTDGGDRSELPTLPDGPDVLYISYSAPAEWACWLALGWDLPSNIIDLYLLDRMQKNGFAEFRKGKWRPLRCSLLRLMEERGFGHLAIAEAEKRGMRDLVRRGGPYTVAEKSSILDYCLSDVRALEVLLPAMLPPLDLQSTLLLGDFTRVLAWMDWNGVPVDVPTCRRLGAENAFSIFPHKSIFHRFNTRLDDALDSSHAHTQAPHRKASAASHRHLRSLQFAF